MQSVIKFLGEPAAGFAEKLGTLSIYDDIHHAGFDSQKWKQSEKESEDTINDTE